METIVELSRRHAFHVSVTNEERSLNAGSDREQELSTQIRTLETELDGLEELSRQLFLRLVELKNQKVWMPFEVITIKFD